MLKRLLELAVVHIVLSESVIYRFQGEIGRQCLKHIAWMGSCVSPYARRVEGIPVLFEFNLNGLFKLNSIQFQTK